MENVITLVLLHVNPDYCTARVWRQHALSQITRLASAQKIACSAAHLNVQLADAQYLYAELEFPPKPL